MRDFEASLASVHPISLLRQVRSILPYGRAAWRDAVGSAVDRLLADGIKPVEGEQSGTDGEALSASLAWCDEGSSLAGASPVGRPRSRRGWSQGDP